MSLGWCWSCWAAGLSGLSAARCGELCFIHKSCGCFLVEPCSSNWKGAGNPSVWRALEPLFERSVIFQSNSLLEPLFIKYSEDPFSPGTSNPRLSLKNQSGSSACSNAACIFREPGAAISSSHLISSQSSHSGWGCAGSRAGVAQSKQLGGPGLPFLLLAPKQSFIHSSPEPAGRDLPLPPFIARLGLSLCSAPRCEQQHIRAGVAVSLQLWTQFPCGPTVGPGTAV